MFVYVLKIFIVSNNIIFAIRLLNSQVPKFIIKRGKICSKFYNKI